MTNAPSKLRNFLGCVGVVFSMAAFISLCIVGFHFLVAPWSWVALTFLFASAFAIVMWLCMESVDGMS